MTTAAKLSIKGIGIENECTGIVGDFLDLDRGMTADSGMGEEFIKEHCPLEIIAIEPTVVTLKEGTGTTFQAELHVPIHYTFKGNVFAIAYQGSN